ncbi:MAG: replication protein [Ruminococcaceae bacterium]|nr:replication protein [Oscillospiraceae bacterium]
MCDEIGQVGTPHTHIFFIAKNGVMFDTVQKRFYGAHIEKVLGSNEDNYNYVRKIGEKYENKAETNLPDTFEESGELPPDRKGANSLSNEILEMIENDCSEFDILQSYPAAIYKINSIRQAKEVFDREKFKNEKRDIKVYYIWGKSGVGKTRYVMDKYGYSNVYRVTDYKHPFDDYQGQKVIMFEEFRGQIDIENMLNYLDIYPLSLPCRYANKIAMYDTVYITTNIPITEQYQYTQQHEFETYNALLRRITDFIEMK